MVKPAASWSGEETLFGDTQRTFTVILRTSGCAWNRSGGGCFMCGYSSESDSALSPEDVVGQLDGLEIPPGDTAKIYTSGSFLDPAEISFDGQRGILRRFHDAGYGKAVVETRPEFVTLQSLANLSRAGMDHIELAFGLESADDRVRRLCVNKGFTWDDFTASAALARERGFGVRVYLLLKPPFLSERRALEDINASLDALEGIADVVSVNPVNVQKGTRVEVLFKKGQYRPPWYWTLFRALERRRGFEVVSFPSGGGSERGIHNCRACNRDAAAALDKFNVEKDPSVFSQVTCGCKREWEALLENESLSAAGNLNYRLQNRDW